MHSSLQYGNGRRSGQEVRELLLARGHQAADVVVPSHGLRYSVTTCPVEALFHLLSQGSQTSMTYVASRAVSFNFCRLLATTEHFRQETAVFVVNLYDLCSEDGGGWDSSVGIAIRCGLDGPGIESRCGRDFPHLSTPALCPTQPPIQWVPRLSRG